MSVLTRVLLTLACAVAAIVSAYVVVVVPLDWAVKFALVAFTVFFISGIYASVFRPENWVSLFGQGLWRDTDLVRGAALYGIGALVFGLMMWALPERPLIALLVGIPIFVTALMIHIRWLIRFMQNKQK